jgi:hypothetical protein
VTDVPENTPIPLSLMNFDVDMQVERLLGVELDLLARVVGRLLVELELLRAVLEVLVVDEAPTANRWHIIS